MMLSSIPTYYNNDSPDKQCEVIRTYLITLKKELEDAFNSDYSVDKRFDAVNKTLSDLDYSIKHLSDYVNMNYQKKSDMEANGIVIGDHTYTEQKYRKQRREVGSLELYGDNTLIGIADIPFF